MTDQNKNRNKKYLRLSLNKDLYFNIPGKRFIFLNIHLKTKTEKINRILILYLPNNLSLANNQTALRQIHVKYSREKVLTRSWNHVRLLSFRKWFSLFFTEQMGLSHSYFCYNGLSHIMFSCLDRSANGITSHLLQ